MLGLLSRYDRSLVSRCKLEGHSINSHYIFLFHLDVRMSIKLSSCSSGSINFVLGAHQYGLTPWPSDKIRPLVSSDFPIHIGARNDA